MDADSRYWPRVSGGAPARLLRLGPYTVRVEKDLESSGKIHYLYLLYVHDSDGELRLCVASERNERHAELVARGEKPSGRSHFLGVFTGEQHQNLGSSDEWADLDAFTARALGVAGELLGVTDPPLEI